MENAFRGMTFQVATVSKLLGSVERICVAGHGVVFEDVASYIENLATGEINVLCEDNGYYMLDIRVLPPQTTEWGHVTSDAPPIFGRPL